MSSLKTDLLSDMTKVPVPADGIPGVVAADSRRADKDLASHTAEIEEANLHHHVTTLIKAYKNGTELDPSYDAIFKTVINNAKSRDALIKAFMEHTSLSHPVVADLPKAVEITSNHVKATAGETVGVEKKLIPPAGTRGFSNQVYRIGSNWIVDVYAYRHANSNDVTVIVIHSGPASTTTSTTFSIQAIPDAGHKFHYPMTYESDLGDGRYSYRIGYRHHINMIGPDGKNPIPVELFYNEDFIAPKMSFTNDPRLLAFSINEPFAQIHGMSVFNASFEVGTSMTIYFTQSLLLWPPHGGITSGTAEVRV